MSRLDPNRFLSLDVGEKRVGVAAGSLDTGYCEPLETLLRSGDGRDRPLITRLREIVKAEKAASLIVGDPLNMDGSVGERSESCRAFAKRLQQAMRQVRVEMSDERLSSFEADEWMERNGVRKSKRKAKRDAYAAAVILTDYFRGKRLGQQDE